MYCSAEFSTYDAATAWVEKMTAVGWALATISHGAATGAWRPCMRRAQ